MYKTSQNKKMYLRLDFSIGFCDLVVKLLEMLFGNTQFESIFDDEILFSDFIKLFSLESKLFFRFLKNSSCSAAKRFFSSKLKESILKIKIAL